MKFETILAIFFLGYSNTLTAFSRLSLEPVFESVKTFEEWKLLAGKEYSSNQDEQRAMQFVTEELSNIRKHNSRFVKGLETYTRQLWSLSDLENRDKRKLNRGFRVPSSLMGFFDGPTERELYSEAPKSLDWRTFSYISPVKDQGLICAACFAFSSIGAIEAHLAMHRNTTVKLSEQQVIDCNYNETVGNWGCDGGLMASSFAYLSSNNGISDESAYPYEEETKSCRFDPNHSVANITSFVELTSSNEEYLKNVLSQVGPISVAIDGKCDGFFSYQGGVYFDSCCSQVLTHAVLLIGYGTDPTYGDYWILKNSWGTSWGEGGFFRLKRNASNHCGIGLYCTYPVL